MTAAGVSSRSPAKDKTTFEQEALHSLKVLWLPRGHKNKKKTRETFFTASSRRSTGRQYHYWPFGGQSLGADIETVGVCSSISSGNVASSSMTIGLQPLKKNAGVHSDVSGRLVRRSGGERCRKTAGLAARTVGGGFRGPVIPA